MTKVVVDTDILIDYTYGKAEWVDEIATKSRKVKLILPTVAMGEFFVSQRFSNANDKRAAVELISHLFINYDFNTSIALLWADLNRSNLFPPGANTIDTMVAATALYLNAPLATRNLSHFKGIPNLKFFTP